MVTKKQIANFQNKIYSFYKINRRDFPWRKSISPYRIVVSEIMLQQTQAPRVIKKFTEFIYIFPNFKSLSKAPLKKILKVWSGLGYNRRAKFLKLLAQEVVTKYSGKLPHTHDILIKLPGIGPHTAGSIIAFAYNKPTIFIETNIRSVFINEFFKKQLNIHDKDILPLIEQTLDTQNPRDWYNALMDYGSMLKQTYKNPSRNSAHYVRQTKFKGSDRELRGKILKLLTSEDRLDQNKIIKKLDAHPERINKILNQLVNERLVCFTHEKYYID